MTPKAIAADLNARALALQKRGKFAEAIELYQRAIAMAPRWSVPLYNLGLLFKRQRRWQESLDCNYQATAVDRKNQEAWWNLGIAATALGDWKTARLAWRGFGIDIPKGEGPIQLACGATPIRINPDADAEVVWSERIDPARAVLVSIPFPESKHRWGDLVLHDGAPVGYRKLGGQDVPVFDELQLLQPSEFATFVARVAMPAGGTAEKLAQAAQERGGCAEDWSTSVRIICKACSEGRPHAEHDHLAAPADDNHMIGIAAKNQEHADSMLAAWTKEMPNVRVEGLQEALAAGR